MNRIPRILVITLAASTLVSSAMGQAPRVNLAKYQAIAASSQTSADPAVYATDGIVGNENRWKSNGAGPQTLAITLPLAMQIGSAHLYLGRDDLEPVAGFVLQYWTGSSWVAIPGATFAGNAATVLNVVFTTPVTTSKVRFYSTESAVRVREIALFAPNGAGGYPLGTDVTLILAAKHPVTVSSVDGANHGIDAFDGFADDASRWKSSAATGPHTLEVNLENESRLGSVHLYTGSATSAPLTDFSLEGYSGSTWTAIPGGTVTGNTEAARRVQFTAPVAATKIRLTVPATPAVAARVREMVVFAAQTGLADNWPIGTNVLTQAPPTTSFDTYGDGWYKIVNRSLAHSLIVSASGASQTIDATTEPEKLFQILWNIESGTFRLRNQDSYLCIGAKNGGSQPGTAVVEMPDYQAMPHELWRFDDMGGGYFRIINQGNNLALETTGVEPTVVTLATPSTSTRQQWQLSFNAPYPKKGMGGWDGKWDQFAPSWTYNWSDGTSAGLPADRIFSPMQYRQYWPDVNQYALKYSAFHTTTRFTPVLGFNEPDHTDQANMSVADAISMWPKLMVADLPLVSPVPASAYGGWLGDFYSEANSRGYRVDYTAVHWYGSPNSDSLISHLQSVYNTWGRPVWLTEFSCVDWSNNQSWSEEENYRFLAEFMWKAEDKPWLKRYANFSFSGDPPANQWEASGPRSDTFKSNNNTLTPYGELYASWDGDRTIKTRTPYLLTNKHYLHRVRNSSTSTSPVASNLSVSDEPAQWAFVPAPISNRFYLVSFRDGKRLRFNGTLLDYAAPGTIGASVEWNYAADADGYFFIEHPSTSKRLRLNRQKSGSTVTGHTIDMFSNVTDSAWNLRWRFIKPVVPGEVAPPIAPTGLAITSGTQSVNVSWSAAAADGCAVVFSLYRRPAIGGMPVKIGTNLPSPFYSDTTAGSGQLYYYSATTTDWFDQESPASIEKAGTPAGSYAAWALSSFAGNTTASQLSTDDPDGDQLNNLLEYGTGSNPLKAGVSSPLMAG